MSVETSPHPGLEIVEQMYGAVLSRFPLLLLLQFADQPDSSTTQIPSFVGLIATLFQSGDAPCCVVLPDKKDVAIAVSTLTAVTHLRRDFAEILRKHASVTFKEGNDHVLVHPCGLVYRYEGFFTPELFKLKVIDKKEARSLPVTEIARLEKTMHKRPKGRLDSDLGLGQPTVLGSLLGIKTPPNRNFLRNYVLILGARKHFVEALDRWTIQAPTVSKNLKRLLREEVPFGKVIEGGGLCFLDGYVAAGEPLVAVASRSDDLAAHCRSVGKFTKAVLVDEIEYLTRDFSAYDAITESQHTVILASEYQHESIRQLEERGCEIWRLTPDEILYGLNIEVSKVSLGNAVAKAMNARNLVISGRSCKEEELEKAADTLQEVANTLSATDNGSVRELLYSLFRILMFCAEYLGQNPQQFANSTEKLLQLAKKNLDNAKPWLSPEASGRTKEVIENMRDAVSQLSTCIATPKGELLLERLNASKGQTGQIAIIVARNETNCDEVRHWLKKYGLQAEIYSIRGLPEQKAFDRIMVVSWPRSARFDYLAHQFLTNDLELLAYSFEEEWLNKYRRAYKRSALSGITAKRKMQRLGLSTTGILDEQSDTQAKRATEELVKFNLPLERFLTRRKTGFAEHAGSLDGEQDELVEACYVDFTGPTFAYLTEGHELPVLTAYVSGLQVASAKIPLRSIEDLKEGDFVMFRESGDSDIIRFLAEDQVGKDRYNQLRLTVNRWRVTLRKLGSDPKQVLERLRPFGFSRHLQTVRGWLDRSTICPQEIADVRIIAGAAHDKELFASLPEMEQARDELTSLHISAGHRLTELLLKDLPNKLNLIGKGETKLDLGVGEVWVVRIEEIERTTSSERRSQVNHLLWDAGAV